MLKAKVIYMLLAYAVDNDITERKMRDETAVYRKIGKESAKIGLEFNEHKTMILVAITTRIKHGRQSSSRQV